MASFLGGHASWELRAYPDPDAGEGSDREQLQELDAFQCSAEFLHMLIQLKISGALSAKQACLLSYWASRGGLIGEGALLGAPPGKTGGTYSNKFDKVTGVNLRGHFYDLHVPCFERWSHSRVIRPIATSLVHNEIIKEVESTPTFWSDMPRLAETTSWGPVWLNHPLVRGDATAKVVPLAPYSDGVQYEKRDTVTGLWLINLASGKRHLILPHRKRIRCACACKGWCSMYAALELVKWHLKTFVEGMHPRRRHDNTEWSATDPCCDKAGAPLGFRGACLFMKGDLLELCKVLGYPIWASHAHPCFFFVRVHWRATWKHC